MPVITKMAYSTGETRGHRAGLRFGGASQHGTAVRDGTLGSGRPLFPRSFWNWSSNIWCDHGSIFFTYYVYYAYICWFNICKYTHTCIAYRCFLYHVYRFNYRFSLLVPLVSWQGGGWLWKVPQTDEGGGLLGKRTRYCSHLFGQGAGCGDCGSARGSLTEPPICHPVLRIDALVVVEGVCFFWVGEVLASKNIVFWHWKVIGNRILESGFVCWWWWWCVTIRWWWGWGRVQQLCARA